MTAAEKLIVRRFSEGEKKLRQEAIDIYHKYLGNEEAKQTVEMKFMSEIDNSRPDYTLLRLYRQQLVS